MGRQVVGLELLWWSGEDKNLIGIDLERMEEWEEETASSDGTFWWLCSKGEQRGEAVAWGSMKSRGFSQRN